MTREEAYQCLGQIEQVVNEFIQQYKATTDEELKKWEELISEAELNITLTKLGKAMGFDRVKMEKCKEDIEKARDEAFKIRARLKREKELNDLLLGKLDFCVSCTEKLYAYIRATRDYEVLLDWCDVGASIDTIKAVSKDEILGLQNWGRLIQDFTLRELWGVSREDIRRDKYFINRDGECVCRLTGKTIPRPSDQAQEPQQETPTERDRLIAELGHPDRVKKYFGRAVELGYMTPNETGYKWEFGGRECKARLGWFVMWMLEGEVVKSVDNDQRLIMEQLFSVHRLDRTIDQNFDTGKSQKVKKWRAEIERNIFFD